MKTETCSHCNKLALVAGGSCGRFNCPYTKPGELIESSLEEIKTPINQTHTRQAKQEAALRYDADKPRWELLPPDALNALVQVYTVGAKKYADRNWERGMSFSRCFGSLMRHSWKWWSGEEWDEETKCHHLAHAAWNALALLAYVLRKVGIDDRPRQGAETSARDQAGCEGT